MHEQCAQQRCCMTPGRESAHKGTPPTVEAPTRAGSGRTGCGEGGAAADQHRAQRDEKRGRLAPVQATTRRSPDKQNGGGKGRRASLSAELSLSDVAFCMDFGEETLQLEGWTVMLDAASEGPCDWR